MNLLYLVGEEHIDPDGYMQLQRLLTAMPSAAIGIEDTEAGFRKTSIFAQNPDAVRLGTNNWKRSFPRANAKTVTLFVQNLIYRNLLLGSVLQKGNLFFCDDPAVIDSPVVDHAFANTIKQSLELEDLVRLSPKQLRTTIAKAYASESYRVSDNPALAQFYSARDQFAEQVLRHHVSPPASGQVVYFGGLDHFYGDYHPNLFDRLADLNPTRMKLSDVGSLSIS